MQLDSIGGRDKSQKVQDLNDRDQALEALTKDLAAKHIQRAVEQARVLLDTYPQDPIVLGHSGEVFLQAGQFTLARDAFRAALALGVDSAQWQEAAGRTSWLLQDWGSAAAHFERALAIGPYTVDLEVHFAGALLECGYLSVARTRLRRVARFAPERADVRRLLGRIAQSLGEKDEALAHYDAAIARSPEHGPDYMARAAILEEIGRWGEAIQAYEEASEASPNNVDLWLRLGSCFQTIGQGSEASRCYERAVQVNPGSPQAYVACANMYSDEGQIERAWRNFESAQKCHPGFVPARIGEANLLERMGSEQAALERLRMLQQEFPERPAVLMLAGRLAKTQNERQLALTNLEGCLKELQKRESQELAALVRFSIARLCDRVGRYDDAYGHLREANMWRRTAKPYSREHAKMDVEGMRKLCAINPVVKKTQKTSDENATPIFLIGMPRSGTSLAEQILSSHPNVYGAGELNILNDLVRDASDGGAGEKGAHEYLLSSEKLRAMGGAYRESLPEEGRGNKYSCITDKMPHNFRYVSLILSLFPEARIIHCYRDPLDTCLSCYMQNFAEGNSYSHDLADCGFFYRQYASLMDHWRSVLEKPFFELQYETLVSDPESTVRALLEYCGLEWNDACLRFHENKRVVHTASYQQVREPFYTRSIGRWRHYAAYLRPLIEELGDLVSEEDRAYVFAAAEREGKGQDGASAVAAG